MTRRSPRSSEAPDPERAAAQIGSAPSAPLPDGDLHVDPGPGPSSSPGPSPSPSSGPSPSLSPSPSSGPSSGSGPSPSPGPSSGPGPSSSPGTGSGLGNSRGPARAASSGPGQDGARRRALVDERDFLLRSLQDLERELQAGDIVQVDYEALRSRYTGQAAAVLRALNALDAGTAGRSGIAGAGRGARRRRTQAGLGVAGGSVVESAAGESAAGESAGLGVAGAPVGGGSAGGVSAVGVPDAGSASAVTTADGFRSRRRTRRRRLLVGGAVACFVAAAVVLVVSHLGVKLPGQPVTGSITLARAQQEQRLLGQAETALVESKPADALVAYRQVLALDPTQPEALSETGWLEYAAGVHAHDATLVRSGQHDEAQAAAQHPGAFAPRFYLGSMLAQEGDAHAAVAQFDAGLADHPPVTTLSVFAATIVKTFGEAHVPVPAAVVAAEQKASSQVGSSPGAASGSGSGGSLP